MELWNLAIMAVCLVVIGAVIIRAASRRTRVTRDTPLVELIKRRRELFAQLHNIVGDDALASRMAQIEAQRLNTRSTSIEALEAAIERAVRERKAEGQNARYGAV